MKGFLTAFSLECKKIFSSKGFWIFAVVILILCLIVTATFRTLGEMLEGMDESVITGSTTDATPAQLAEAYREQLAQYREAVANGDVEVKWYDTTETRYKNMIAIYEYCDQHNLNPSKLTYIGSVSSLRMSSADYVTTMSQITFAFATIMAIVLAARTFAGEIDDGTMRMQLTRPVKRSVLLTAKHTSVFAAAMTVGVVFTVLFMIIGAIFFNASTYDVILVDAYQNVSVINPYAAILISLLFSAVIVEVVIQFTLFIGTFVSKTGALAIPLVLYLFADTVAQLLYSTGLPWVGLFTNLSWISGLTPSGAPLKGMSIYTMMAITTVWYALFTTVNYIAFEKRDLK